MEEAILNGLVKLIVDTCQVNNTKLNKEDKIECVTKITNCVVIGDGSNFYSKVYKDCVKKYKKG